jgi:hypothetical protein
LQTGGRRLGMTVTVASAVGRRWDELREFKGPSIDLWLAVEQDPQAVAALIREAVGSAIGELMPSEEVDPEWSGGSWRVAAVPGAVALHVSEYPDAFEEVLSSIAAQLTAAGLAGRIELARPAVVLLPDRIPLLECRMRPPGVRDGAAWRVKPEDMLALARDAASMLWPAPTAGGWTVRYGLGARTPIDENADHDVLLSEAVATLGTASDVTRSTAAGLESVALNPSQGFVTIIIAQLDLKDGWRSVVARLREFLLTHHEQMVYAFVRRGEYLKTARSGSSLARDWPARPGFKAAAMVEGAWEERWAPDAFAMQLLGSGYAHRIPAGPSWPQSAAGRSSLVEHATPEAWFAQPFVPAGTLPREAPIPDVLAAARSDFQEILVDTDKAWASRY